MLYDVVVVSAIHQRESVITIHISPLAALLPHSMPLCHRWAPRVVQQPPAGYLSYTNSVCTSELLSQFLLASPSPALSASLFSMSVSLFLLCK